MTRRAVLMTGAVASLVAALIGAGLAALLGRGSGESVGSRDGDGGVDAGGPGGSADGGADSGEGGGESGGSGGDSGGSGGDSGGSGGDSGGSGWRLTWSDEFEGAPQEPPDPSRWVPEVGGGGWGNDELQFYTDRTHNAALDGDSHLVITAREDASGGPCWYGACHFTSARLITKGTFAQAYGCFEARIRLPRGQGIWPAFWLLGDDIDAVGWPACGEIDIMEYLGHDEDTVHAALHGPGFDPTATFDLSGGESFADGFHTFAAEWSPDQVQFFVDGHRYGTVDRPDDPGGWVFDHPFFILLNVAVGGRWPGEPDDTTEFPQEMVVDYVRVYEAVD